MDVFDLLDPAASVTVAALVNGLWQGLVLLGLVWSLLRIVERRRRLNATTRYAVWSVTLIAVLCLPVGAALMAATSPEASSQPVVAETVVVEIKAVHLGVDDVPIDLLLDGPAADIDGVQAGAVRRKLGVGFLEALRGVVGSTLQERWALELAPVVEELHEIVVRGGTRLRARGRPSQNDQGGENACSLKSKCRNAHHRDPSHEGRILT